MNLAAFSARNSLSYVFNVAAGGGTALGAQSDPLGTGAAANQATPASAATTAQSATTHDPDPSYSLLDYIRDPSSVTSHRMQLHAIGGQIVGEAILSTPSTPPVPTEASEAEGPIRVRDMSHYSPDMLPYAYLMTKSMVDSRTAAGQSATIIEGYDGQPVDAAQYLDRMKEAAIAVLEAKGSVDKTA